MTTPITHKIEIAPKTIVVILGVIALVWLVGRLTSVLTVVTVALILVGTFDPVVAWLEHRGLRRGRALVVVFVVAALAFAALVLLMVPPLFSQLIAVIENAPHERDQIVKAVSEYRWADPMVGALKAIPMDGFVTHAGTALLSYSSALFEFIGYGISTMFLAIYLLVDPARSKGMLYTVVPRHHHVKLAKILLELKVIVGGYMRGQLITSLAIAVFVFALLTILGADDPLAIALFAGLTDIIPFVGGYVASAPVVFAVSGQGAVTTVVVAGLMILYQEFESRFLVPRVYGQVLRLPPAVVVVALLVGGTLAGILGALLALPIAAGLHMVLHELRVDLPGNISASHVAIERDERATDLYEELTVGVSTVDAGVIADDLATIMKHSEETDESSSVEAAAAVAKEAAEATAPLGEHARDRTA